MSELILSSDNLEIQISGGSGQSLQMQGVSLKGDKGDKGDPGYTPVKGIDYWTEEDKTEIIGDVEADIQLDLDAKADKADTYTKSEIDSTVQQIYSDTGYKDGYEDAIDTYVTPGQLYRIIGPETPSDGVIIVPSDFEPYFIFATSNFVLSVGAGELYYTQYRIKGKSVSRRMYTLRPNDEGFTVIDWTEWESVVWKNEADEALELKADITVTDALQKNKAYMGTLSDVDLTSVKNSGIYNIGENCTGFPEGMPEYICGATLIVSDNTDSYYKGETQISCNQYLIINDYADSTGASTMHTRIYANMVYSTGYDMAWQLILDSADHQTLDDKADYKYIDNNLSNLSEEIEKKADKTAVDTELERIEAVAKGRATGYVFDTVDDMNTWLADAENTAQLVLGDNLYIRALDVPDYWWDGAQAQQLETQKVDLSEYVKNTDYATGEKAGVIKLKKALNGTSTSGLEIDDEGQLTIKTNTSFGLRISNNGMLFVSGATEADIDAKISQNKPIVPYNLEYAIKSCTDSTVTADGELPVSGATVHTELAAKADKTTFIKLEDTSALVTMLSNTETRLGTVTQLEIILPETIPEDYISSVVFTSGETGAVFIQPMYLYLSGEGCTDGVFTPEVNMRYTIVLSYDGVSVSGIVGGVPLT